MCLNVALYIFKIIHRQSGTSLYVTIPFQSFQSINILASLSPPMESTFLLTFKLKFNPPSIYSSLFKFIVPNELSILDTSFIPLLFNQNLNLLHLSLSNMEIGSYLKPCKVFKIWHLLESSTLISIDPICYVEF